VTIITTNTIVVIDDDPMSVELVSTILASDKIRIYGANDGSSGLEQVRQTKPQIVILDLMLPDITGMEMLDKILEIDSSIDVILLTGRYSTDSAVQAIHRGACDYLTKPFLRERLQQRVDMCLSDLRARQQAKDLDAELLLSSHFEGIVGRSPQILELFSKIKRVAPHYQTVLVRGETGTGKELIARALHALSPVARGPYIVCNCAALPETLFESELFGHVKGAFTGAVRDKLGLVEHAQGGTLFLDEIGEMPVVTQGKLLRLIQNREIQRLGAPAPRKVDVRIIAATHQNLQGMLAEKRFRQDLYYRLSIIELNLPNLVSRREDISLLQQHFLRVYSERYGKAGLQVTRGAQAVLASHTWPGNVRELENALSHACMLAEGATIEPRHLPEAVRSPQKQQTDDVYITLKALQQQHVTKVLESTQGNVLQAARVLGISRATLYRFMSARPVGLAESVSN
jgi:DNA-binding NtrC family response regulator